MSEKTYKTAWLCIALYLLVGVICFGPATVQSERAQADWQAQCRAERAGNEGALHRCQLGGPSITDGAPKAMLWPLWLSYTMAQATDQAKATAMTNELDAAIKAMEEKP